MLALQFSNVDQADVGDSFRRVQVKTVVSVCRLAECSNHFSKRQKHLNRQAC
jgi:hypothetical protein